MTCKTCNGTGIVEREHGMIQKACPDCKDGSNKGNKPDHPDAGKENTGKHKRKS